MNKNFKVIQVNGLSGIIILGFLATGLFCGFIIFPIWVVMISWNAVARDMLNGPVINYGQAALLWSAVILSFYILLKNSISIKIQKEENFDPKDIKDIVSEANEKDISEISEIKEKEESHK